MQNKPIIIECVGLPGAGKTTIAGALHNALLEAGVPTQSNTSLQYPNKKMYRYIVKIGVLFRSLLRPRIMLRAWRCSSVLPLRQRFRFMSVLVVTITQQNSSKLKLYDQGVYNFLLTAIARSVCSIKTAISLRNCLHQAGVILPTHILEVDIDSKTAQTRVESREKNHVLKTKPSHEQKRFFDTYQSSMYEIFDDSTERLVVSGKESAEQTAKYAMEHWSLAAIQ